MSDQKPQELKCIAHGKIIPCSACQLEIIRSEQPKPPMTAPGAIDKEHFRDWLSARRTFFDNEIRNGGDLEHFKTRMDELDHIYKQLDNPAYRLPWASDLPSAVPADLTAQGDAPKEMRECLEMIADQVAVVPWHLAQCCLDRIDGKLGRTKLAQSAIPQELMDALEEFKWCVRNTGVNHRRCEYAIEVLLNLYENLNNAPQPAPQRDHD